MVDGDCKTQLRSETRSLLRSFDLFCAIARGRRPSGSDPGTLKKLIFFDFGHFPIVFYTEKDPKRKFRENDLLEGTSIWSKRASQKLRKWTKNDALEEILLVFDMFAKRHVL